MLGSIFSRLAGGGGPELSFEEVAQAAKTDSAVLVDVRETAEFGSGHIPGSVNMPLSRFDPGKLPADKPAILFCLSGARSASALSQCRRAGREGDRNYRGGVPDWRAHGGEITR